MRNTARLSFATLLAALSLGAWSADANRLTPDTIGRQEHARRQFGDVSFVMGSGRAMEWLEMYVGRNLVAAYRDFDADEVLASPDRQYFLAISNKAYSSLAFAVLDRQGHIVFSDTHGSDALRYCGRSATNNWQWIDAADPRANFELASTDSAAPPREYLKSVTVRGCDGNDVLLGRGTPPGQKTEPPRRVAATTAPGNQDRGSFFIGDTIANLRGMDPNFGDRTLTLTDGRRKVQPASPPPADTSPAADSTR